LYGRFWVFTEDSPQPARGGIDEDMLIA